MTILGVQQGFIQQLGTAEDFELGGAEVDDALVNYCVTDFKRKAKMDPRESARCVICMHVCTYVCTYVYVRMYMRTYVRTYVWRWSIIV